MTKPGPEYCQHPRMPSPLYTLPVTTFSFLSTILFVNLQLNITFLNFIWIKPYNIYSFTSGFVAGSVCETHPRCLGSHCSFISITV